MQHAISVGQRGLAGHGFKSFIDRLCNKQCVLASGFTAPQKARQLGAVLALTLAGSASAAVIFDNFHGSSGVPSVKTPNYVNNTSLGAQQLQNLLDFAANPANIASSGMAANIDWNTTAYGLCDNRTASSQTSAMCAEGIMGKVIYALVKFPDAGNYSFKFAHDDEVKVEFASQFAASNAGNYRAFDYNVPVGSLTSWTSSDSTYVNLPGNFVIPKAGACYVMRVHWNNKNGLTHLRMQWTKPGSSTAETIPAAQLLDPSDPNSYASCVTESADIAVSKTGPATFVAGTAFDYSISVWNNGTVDANNISVTDQLPSDVTITTSPYPVSCTPTGAATCGSDSAANGVLVFQTGNLPAQSGVSNPVDYLTYTVKVTPKAGVKTLTNTVTVTVNDANPDNNTAIFTNAADDGKVHIGKTGPGSVVAGQEFDYTVTLTNGMASALASPVVAEQLPASVYAVSVVGANCGAMPSAPGQLLTCTLSSPVAAGGAGMFSLTAKAAASGTVTNYVATNPSGGSTPGKPGPACVESATVTCGKWSTRVVALPVAVGKSFTPAVINVGGSIVLRISLSNVGGVVNLTNLVLTDALPSGVSAVGNAIANTCGGTPMHAAGVITLAGASLAANDACYFDWEVTANAVDDYVNTIPSGNVTTAQGATNGAAAEATLSVVAQTVDKALTGVNGQAVPAGYSVAAGDLLTYTLTVKRQGSVAGSATLTETVGAGVQYAGVNEGWGAGCTTAASSCSQTVSVPEATGAVPGEASVSFTVQADASLSLAQVSNEVQPDAMTGCGICTVFTPVATPAPKPTPAEPQPVPANAPWALLILSGLLLAYAARNQWLTRQRRR